MNLLAFDTETHAISDRKTLRHGAHEINVSPYVTPRIVLGSLAWLEGDQVRSEVLDPEELRARVMAHLRGGHTLLMHHAPFDADVILTAFPHDWTVWRRALDEGRVLDTEVLDVLYRLSVGWFDRPDPSANWATPELRVRTLADLASSYCGLTLDKDPDVRLGFGEWEGRVDELPPRFRRYAAQDAVATLAVALHLLKQTGAPWDAAAQTRAEVAMYSMKQHGMAIDRGEAIRLRALFKRDMPALQAALVDHALGRWKPVPGTSTTVKRAHDLDTPAVKDTGWLLRGATLVRQKVFKNHWTQTTATPGFHLNTKDVRARLAALATELELDDTDLKYTDGGELSIVADEWADRIPAGRVDLESWAQHEKLKKILTAYLNLYSQVDRVFPRWRSIGARSGRMSASSPAVQQVPKRKYGIRSLFVPSDGCSLVIADYATQEVLTLAEVMHGMGLDGPLLAALQAGGDLHRRTASALLDKHPDNVTPADRQAAKAVVFGVPGGLGARRLADYARKSYGLDWDVPTAKRMRDAFLATYPDIAAYLESLKTGLDGDLRRASGRGLAEWKRELGASKGWELRQIKRKHPDPAVRGVLYTAERSLTVTLPTGFVRKGCTFTEGANSYFQGLAAAVTKEAVWRFFSQAAFPNDAHLVAVVHDEIVAECVTEHVPHCARELERCMLDAFRALCPHVGHLARVEVTAPAARWGKATDAQGDLA